MRNVYKVKKTVWKKWSPTAQRVFNAVYQQVRRSQYLYVHPRTAIVAPMRWRTTAWNVAWTAAAAVDVVTTRPQ